MRMINFPISFFTGTKSKMKKYYSIFLYKESYVTNSNQYLQPVYFLSM